MPVTMTISESSYDALNPDHYTGEYDCRPLYFETTYAGLVLSTFERNGYDDSDFFAVVWDAEKGETKDVMYATTRGWTYCNGATADATPEVVAAYKAHLAERKAAAVAYAAEKAAKNPAVKGKTVKVVRGRKVPKGTVGDVFWVGRCNYSGKPRVGMKDETGETYWLAASNLEVVAPL